MTSKLLRRQLDGTGICECDSVIYPDEEGCAECGASWGPGKTMYVAELDGHIMIHIEASYGEAPEPTSPPTGSGQGWIGVPLAGRTIEEAAIEAISLDNEWTQYKIITNTDGGDSCAS